MLQEKKKKQKNGVIGSVMDYFGMKIHSKRSKFRVNLLTAFVTTMLLHWIGRPTANENQHMDLFNLNIFIAKMFVLSSFFFLSIQNIYLPIAFCSQFLYKFSHTYKYIFKIPFNPYQSHSQPSPIHIYKKKKNETIFSSNLLYYDTKQPAIHGFFFY